MNNSKSFIITIVEIVIYAVCYQRRLSDNRAASVDTTGVIVCGVGGARHTYL